MMLLGQRFCYIIFQTFRNLIPAAYENDKSLLTFLFVPLFNMYRDDTSTVTQLFILKYPHMQMSYF